MTTGYFRHWNSDFKSGKGVKWGIVSQTACRGWNVCVSTRTKEKMYMCVCVSLYLCGSEHTWQNMFLIMKWILHHKLHMQMHNYVRVDFVINWLSWKPDTHNKPLSTTPAHMTDVYTVCLGVLFLHPHNITMVLYIMSMQINIYIYKCNCSWFFHLSICCVRKHSSEQTLQSGADEIK